MSAFSFIPWKAQSGSGEGPDLSGITAGEGQILAGYQSVDSNGDVVYGGIYPLNSEPCFGYAESLEGPEVLSVEIPANGYYLKASSGGLGIWIEWADVASAIGLTASKLKTGVTVLGITGN